MDSDERFKHLASDPRFKTLRRKQRKVQIDERFKSMFTDEKFTLKYKQDKRGRDQKKSSEDDLRRYYHLDEKNKKDKIAKVEEEEEEKEEEKEEEEEDEDDDDDDEIDDSDEDEESVIEGEDEEDEQEDNSKLDDNEEEEEVGDSSSSSEEDVSSSSDESDSDEPESEVDDDDKKIQYDWKPLDHDAERADIVTKRIAIQNLDWNHLDVKDIYTLVNSIRPPLSVKIYVSEFGKERLAKEEIEGPQELADMPQLDEEEEEYQQLEEKMQALQGKGHKTYKINEYEDADEIVDAKNDEIRDRLRRYQLSQMKYYYAIVEFDSPESAQAVYKELDGIEYEGSSLELDLRYVPDEMDFDPADVKAVCDKVPDLATYKAPQFINTALQQTSVKFTWDETDVKRQEKLHKAYTKQELEKDDLAAYLASETDSEEDEDENGEDADGDKSETMTVMTGNSEARANKYRQLLKSLDEEQERKKKTDVDVVWGDYESASESEKEDERAANTKKMKQQQQKKKKSAKSDNKRETSKRKSVEEIVPDPDLDLLVMDGSKQEDFEFNPDDDRFRAVYESGLYNIDPSHPNFKRTEALNQIAERKREKRRKLNQ